ncbi:conserved membrane hypothetical protein [Exiguobacterium sp. 8H]|uniref:hypothetical protein n=1 Tax=Exiguobacterium TaxID=33986 RepID=UPI0012F276BF|nr:MULTISPECIES: hypothetical protein [Exiguobacterium]VXA96737.1 conserved membrane hypothetical protein [Exiguobacterium sp. 8A]VXA97338.1 conserved membrane hypothetical protein [Exiguobacterium sp. 8H]
MIGYLILLGFWVLATLTLFALSVPMTRKRETKLVISLWTALLSAGVYLMVEESLVQTWWAWVILIVALIGGVAASVFVEERNDKTEQEEAPQRMVK